MTNGINLESDGSGGVENENEPRMVNEETELEPMAFDSQDEPAGASGGRMGSGMEMIWTLLSEPTAVPRRCTPNLDHGRPERTKRTLVNLTVPVR
jgi:hypothetical protein